MPFGDGRSQSPIKAASPCSTWRCRKSCPAKSTDRGRRMAFFEALQRDEERVIAKCPFMSSHAVQHPEYGALFDG